MSTKMTLKYRSTNDDTDFHLYLECFEGDAVYLKMKHPKGFCLTEDEITIRIPQKVFEKFATEDLIKAVDSHSRAINSFGDNLLGNLESIANKGEEE